MVLVLTKHCIPVQVADAANEAAFNAALVPITYWAELNGFDNILTYTIRDQESLVKQLLLMRV